MNTDTEIIICGQKFKLLVIDWIAGKGCQRLVKFKENDKYLVYDHIKQDLIHWFDTEDKALNYMQKTE